MKSRAEEVNISQFKPIEKSQLVQSPPKKSFKIGNMISVVNSPQLSEKLSLFHGGNSISSSKHETMSLFDQMHRSRPKDFKTMQDGSLYGSTRNFSNPMDQEQFSNRSDRDIPKSEMSAWHHFDETSLDESYSVIQLEDVPAENLISNLRQEMKSVAENKGFRMLNFRGNYLYFVFIRTFGACFYQNSDIKNFSK